MNKVFQCGLGRTGSTLIYRVLKELYPSVNKCHPPFIDIRQTSNSDCKIVVSIRNPIDSLLSYIRVNEFPDSEAHPYSNNLLNKYLGRRIQEEKELREILTHYPDKILVLKYEKFYNDFSYIFSNMQDFFNIQIDKNIKEHIVSDCSINNSIKIQNSMSSFHSYDKDSFIHGRHISTPAPKESYKFINDEQLQFLESNLKDAISFWSKY